jgi:hypothetical protein
LLPCKILAQQASAEQPSPEKGQSLFQKQPQVYIQNKGQWSSDVKFLCQSSGMNMWITDHGVLYDLHREVWKDTNGISLTATQLRDPRAIRNRRLQVTGHVVEMNFENITETSAAIGGTKESGIYNYFLGNDSTKWVTDVPTYSDIRTENLYDGISAAFYTDHGSPRYDIILKPGADLAQVKMRFAGQDGIVNDGDSAITLKTSMGDLEQCQLFAYQMKDGAKVQVPCRFAIGDDGTVQFKVGKYDELAELVIDPLIFSTCLGANGAGVIWAMAVDGSGNPYVTGGLTTLNPPATAGAYQTTFVTGSSNAVFVAKLATDGTSLVYCTYLGGLTSGELDDGYAIAVDNSGVAYLTGSVFSSSSTTSFPIVSPCSACTPTYTGGNIGVVYVSKISSAGNALLYSTYLGGKDNHAHILDYDLSSAIAVDGSHHMFVYGVTSSVDFPTVSPFQSSLKPTTGNYNAFICQLSSDGSSLVYSSYMGGTVGEFATGMAIDGSSNVYLAGGTSSSDFPTTAGAFQQAAGHTAGGNQKPYLAKVNSSGALVFATIDSGSGAASVAATGLAAAVDGSGFPYLAGYTQSHTFPTTSGAYQAASALESGGTAGFVSKFSTDGSSLVAATTLGGTAGSPSSDAAASIAVDGSGNIFICGGTASGDITATAGAYQTTSTAGGADLDGYVAEFSSTCGTLSYFSYFGGVDDDVATEVLLGSSPGVVYLNGWTTHTDHAVAFPTSPGAYHTTSGNYDTWIAELQTLNASVSLTAPASGATWCAGSTQSITWTSSGITNMKVEVSTDGGSTWTTITSTASASGGTYSWAIPTSQAAGTTYKIRLSDASNAATNSVSSAFNMHAQAQMTVALSPSVLWPPTGSNVVVNTTATLTAGCSPSAVRQTITSNETLGGSDITNPTSSTVSLKPTHTAGLSGRYYEIPYLLSDASGNQTVNKIVLVPRNLGTAYPTAGGANAPTVSQTVAEPLTSAANITFNFPSSATGVSIKIYNDKGKNIRTLASNASYPSGASSIAWNLQDRGGHAVHGAVFVQIANSTDHSAPLAMLVQ